MIDVSASAHQMPFRPSEVPLRSMASGMRAPVSTMLMILHSRVRPRPESAPIVSSSTDINASENPMMIR